MIDAHLHLQDCLGEVTAEELLDQLRDIGVTSLMVNATSPLDWHAVSDLASRSKEVVPSFGIHPWKVADASTDWEERLISLLNQFPEAGIGEIGLDKWISGYDLPLQKSLFFEQLSVAQRYGRPATIHCLQAWGSLHDCLKESALTIPFLLHSYSGPKEMVNDWVDLGGYFSISGYFFREEKFSKLAVFESVPEERLLLETDAPEMAFAEGQARFHGRGMKNHPANIELVYEKYADWAGKPLSEVKTMIESNFRRFRDTRTLRPAKE
jgi:TatD DNase family protein